MMTEYAGFCGQSYHSSSSQLDVEDSINLFPEVINVAGVESKRKLVLRRRPGYQLTQTLSDSVGRGVFTLDGRTFAVAGGTFFELTSPTTAVVRGSVPTGSSPVLWAATTTQISIVVNGLVYLFTLATGAFQQVTSPNLPANVVSITSIDTYFLCLGANSNEWACSNLLDGSIYSALAFGSSQEPDNAVAIAQCHLYLWVFGQNETVLYQDSGQSSSPFSRVAGSQIEMGCAGATAAGIADNTLFWLGSHSSGGGIMYRSEGLVPERISTHAVEADIQSYATIADAVFSTYQRDGHLFCAWHFPTAGTAWVYDVSTSMWHKRARWKGASSGSWAEDFGRYVTYNWGQHLVVDFNSANVYIMSRSVATDNGAALRWLRTAPYISDSNVRLFFRSLQIDMQVGGGIPSAAEPQVMVRWTNDGATWSDYRQVPCGAVGEYLTRAITRLLGSARSRAFEVSGTDPVPDLCLIAAYLDVEKGIS